MRIPLLFTLLFLAMTFSIPGGENRAMGSECGPGSAECFGRVDALFTNFSGFIDNILIPLVFGVALLVFLWGMFQYFIVGGGSEESQTKGKQLMLWSIIGFVVMVSIWGIVNIISSGLFGASSGMPSLPDTPTL